MESNKNLNRELLTTFEVLDYPLTIKKAHGSP